MKIGLALSGGGFRATVFHLGVLDRLAARDLLEEVTFLSTVSGGSLCAGLVFALSGSQWPTSENYRNFVLPRVRELLTESSLQGSFVRRLFRAPGSFFRSRANDLSLLMGDLWGIDISLKELPQNPRWMINATSYETARNWRFERHRMGDYRFGYVMDPDLPLTDAMAASAAFPGLIGALVFDTKPWSWVQYKDGSPEGMESISPAFDRVHLWDGGLYDNLGVEALFKPDGGLRDGVDFLIVSDASGRPRDERFRAGFKAAHRLVSIAMDQVRSLRARSVVSYLQEHPSSGRYLQIDNSASYILRNAGREEALMELRSEPLSEEEIRLATEMETTIRQLTPAEFERLYRQGFEVADFTLYAYGPEAFPLVGFKAD